MSRTNTNQLGSTATCVVWQSLSFPWKSDFRAVKFTYWCLIFRATNWQFTISCRCLWFLVSCHCSCDAFLLLLRVDPATTETRTKNLRKEERDRESNDKRWQKTQEPLYLPIICYHMYAPWCWHFTYKTGWFSSGSSRVGSEMRDANLVISTGLWQTGGFFATQMGGWPAKKRDCTSRKHGFVWKWWENHQKSTSWTLCVHENTSSNKTKWDFQTHLCFLDKLMCGSSSLSHVC